MTAPLFIFDIIKVTSGAVPLGLLWAFMAIGIYISYRILDTADLTAEGAYAFSACVVGGLVTKEFLTTDFYNNVVLNNNFLMSVFEALPRPVVATCVAVVAGALAGTITGLLHTKLKISSLLSGILTMTALYSVNLRVLSGKANVVLVDNDFKSISVLRPLQEMEIKSGFLRSIFSVYVKEVTSTVNDNTIIKYYLNKNGAALILSVVLVIFFILLLWLFFNTEIGYAIRATGGNPEMARALGINTDSIKILGFAIANSFVALGGALIAQFDDYAAISVGAGTIVFGLSSVIIGEVLVRQKKSILIALLSVVLGSVIYRVVIAFSLEMHIKTNDLRLLTSVILAVTLSTPVMAEKFGFISKLLKVKQN